MNNQPNLPISSLNSEAQKIFTKQDILQILQDQGYNQDTCYIEPQGYNLISDIAQNFVQQILDTYKYKKKQISPSDIKKAIQMKFPNIYTGENIDNKIVMQNRANALDQVDERVRDVEKKFNQ